MPNTLYVLILTLILAACSSPTEDASLPVATSVAQDETSVIVVEEPTTAPIVVEPTAVPVEPTVQPVVIEPTTVPIQPTAVPIEPTAEPVTSTYNAPAWTNLQLINAATGEAFTLADFAGKTVFVEPMATWCSNCRAQQGNIAAAMAQLNADDFVFISLSVGENVSNETLASYAQRNQFPQLFTVATPDLTSALIDTFGFTITSPPSTPHFTISPIGTVSSLSTGFHSSQEFVEEALAVQNS